MLKVIKRNGQTSVEFAVLIVIVLAAMLTMQMYFKRGVQGRMRTSVDNVGEQYDPRFTAGNIVHRISGSTITNITTQNSVNGIVTLRGDTSFLTETKSGYFRVDAE